MIILCRDDISGESDEEWHNNNSVDTPDGQLDKRCTNYSFYYVIALLCIMYVAFIM